MSFKDVKPPVKWNFGQLCLCTVLANPVKWLGPVFALSWGASISVSTISGWDEPGDKECSTRGRIQPVHRPSASQSRAAVHSAQSSLTVFSKLLSASGLGTQHTIVGNHMPTLGSTGI